jgi:hypothetical protein
MILLLLLQVLTDENSLSTKPDARYRFVKRFSEVSLPATVIGSGWEKSDGLVVDDFRDLDKLPPDQQAIAKQLRQQLGRVGVIGAADYSLVKTKPPIDTITVRIFVFTDARRCDEWWKTKYQAAGHEKVYKTVKDERFDAAVDTSDKGSPSTNKRIMKVGAYLVTTHHLQNGDEHLRAAEHIFKQLSTEITKPSK